MLLGFFQAASMLGTWYTGIGYDGREPTIPNTGKNTNRQWDEAWAIEQIENQFSLEWNKQMQQQINQV